MYHYAGNNPIKYTDPTGRDDKKSDFIFIGKGNIIGYGYISDTIGGSFDQPKNFLFKKFVFEYMSIATDENFDLQLQEIKKQSGQSYSDRPAGEVNKNTELTRAIFADEITYDDLEFSKSTGGYIFYSTGNNADNFSGARPCSFLFISKEVYIFKNLETDEIYIFNSNGEFLQYE